MNTIRGMDNSIFRTPIGPSEMEWKCHECDCDEFKEDNLRFLEKKYDERANK
jgi:hypothetical protein